jgi:hypothetical protein
MRQIGPSAERAQESATVGSLSMCTDPIPTTLLRCRHEQRDGLADARRTCLSSRESGSWQQRIVKQIVSTKQLSRRALTGAAVALFCATVGLAQTHSGAPRAGICQREGSTIVGVTPVRIGKSIRAPKKTHNVNPRYPELPAGTRGSGNWVGEILLAAKGHVSRLWATREVKLTPSFPPFNQAIVDAIRGWQFEPVIVNSKPMPACMTVTVTIDWS